MRPTFPILFFVVLLSFHQLAEANESTNRPTRRTMLKCFMGAMALSWFSAPSTSSRDHTPKDTAIIPVIEAGAKLYNLEFFIAQYLIKNHVDFALAEHTAQIIRQKYMEIVDSRLQEHDQPTFDLAVSEDIEVEGFKTHLELTVPINPSVY